MARGWLQWGTCLRRIPPGQHTWWRLKTLLSGTSGERLWPPHRVCASRAFPRPLPGAPPFLAPSPICSSSGDSRPGLRPLVPASVLPCPWAETFTSRVRRVLLPLWLSRFRSSWASGFPFTGPSVFCFSTQLLPQRPLLGSPLPPRQPVRVRSPALTCASSPWTPALGFPLPF